MIKTSDLIWQDTQHQTLFKLLEEMRQEPFDIRILEQLRFYADQHFCLEEAYMEALAYPEMSNHIKAHNRFRAELAHLSDRPDSMTQQVRESLSLFLEEWLKRHIFAIDKDFEAFVMASDAK